jgi:hypothetical protein
MKSIIVLLISMTIIFTACSTSDTPEVPEITGEPEIKITTPPPVTTAFQTTATTAHTTTPPVTYTPPEPSFISLEEAVQAVINAINQNDEITYNYVNAGTREVDGVHYQRIHGRSSYAGLFYVNSLTAEVFLNVNGELIAFPLNEITKAVIFIQRFNNMPSSRQPVPAFNNINEIPVELILDMFLKEFYIENADFEYAEEQFVNFGVIGATDAYGIYPKTIENYIKEKYNPDFTIEHYDFNILNTYEDRRWGRGLSLGREVRAVWDGENNTVVFIFINNAGGGASYSSTVLKIEPESDIFHAITADTWANYQGGFFVVGYFLQTIKRDIDGSFIILSKQEIDINDGFFTEEEINGIEFPSWVGEKIIKENKFVMTRSEANEIIKEVADTIIFDGELWWYPILNEGYYVAYVRHYIYDDEGREERMINVAEIYVNAVTGDIRFELLI